MSYTFLKDLSYLRQWNGWSLEVVAHHGTSDVKL